MGKQILHKPILNIGRLVLGGWQLGWKLHQCLNEKKMMRLLWDIEI